MSAEKALPTFSIVVPAHGRPDPLVRCLRAIARLDYPPDRFETVVVDDGTPEPLEPRVRERLAGLGAGPEAALEYRVIRQDRTGPAAARNTGVGAAAGDYVAFTDDDCEPRPGWLGAFAAAFARHPDHLLGGQTRNGLPHNPFSSASQLLIDYLYDYYDGSSGRPRLFTSNNMAVSRDLFDEAGGFDSRFGLAAGEDREFCDRWDASRGTTYVRDAVVDHAHAMSFRSFLRQHYNYGRGACDYRRAREERGDGVGLEPLSFYSGLVRYPAARVPGPPGWLLAALMVTTQLAAAVGFVRERLVR